MIELELKQLKEKPKKIGDLKGDPVFQVETKGGLFLIMTKSNGKPRTLGAGSHPATARHIAERETPGLAISELSKSESLEETVLRDQVREFLWLTRRIQEVEK